MSFPGLFPLAFFVLFFVSELFVSVNAVCTGYTFAIGNVQKVDGGNKWSVYDSSCNEVDTLVNPENPCTTGKFSCSAAPIYFNAYHPSGGTYQCVRNANAASEKCGGGSDEISVCCSPDGKASTSTSSTTTSTSTTSTPTPTPTTTTASPTTTNTPTTTEAQTTAQGTTTESSSTSTTSSSSSSSSSSSTSSSSLSSSSLTTSASSTPVQPAAIVSTDGTFVTSDTAPTAATGSQNLSTGAKAGIGAGSAVAGLILIAALFLYCQRPRNREQQPDHFGAAEANVWPPAPGSHHPSSGSGSYVPSDSGPFMSQVSSGFAAGEQSPPAYSARESMSASQHSMSNASSSPLVYPTKSPAGPGSPVYSSGPSTAAYPDGPHPLRANH